jgi:hypothetical protein
MWFEQQNNVPLCSNVSLTLQAYYIYKFFVYKVFFAVVCLYSLFMYIYLYQFSHQ